MRRCGILGTRLQQPFPICTACGAVAVHLASFFLAASLKLTAKKIDSSRERENTSIINCIGGKRDRSNGRFTLLAIRRPRPRARCLEIGEKYLAFFEVRFLLAESSSHLAWKFFSLLFLRRSRSARNMQLCSREHAGLAGGGGEKERRRISQGEKKTRAES